MAKARGIRKQRNDDDAAPFLMMSSARIMRPRPSAVISARFAAARPLRCTFGRGDAYRRV